MAAKRLPVTGAVLTPPLLLRLQLEEVRIVRHGELELNLSLAVDLSAA